MAAQQTEINANARRIAVALNVAINHIHSGTQPQPLTAGELIALSSFIDDVARRALAEWICADTERRREMETHAFIAMHGHPED